MITSYSEQVGGRSDYLLKGVKYNDEKNTIKVT